MPDHSILILRLRPDEEALQLLVPGRVSALPLPELHARLCVECDRLGIAHPPPVADLEGILATGMPNQWLSVVASIAPTRPVDGHVELLADIPVAAVGGMPRLYRIAVKEGTALARRVPGSPGQSGRNLFTGPVPAREPKLPPLPSGANTRISEDGNTLYAACDGEAVFQHFRIDVQPVLIYDGDVKANAVIESRNLPVFIEGSVAEGARITAGPDIYVKGNVTDSQLVSKSAGVTVAGVLTGSPQQKSRIRSASSVTVDQVRLTSITAGGDVHIRSQAWQCTIVSAGDLYLATTMQNALQQVDLEIRGVIRPQIEPPRPVVRTERQYIRVPCALPASYARLALIAPAFFPCTVTDISPGGARCRLESGHLGPEAGDTVQLRFTLPGKSELVNIIGRVVWSAPGTAGVQFLQHTKQDHDRVSAYCRQLLAKNPAARRTSPALRQSAQSDRDDSW